MNYWNMQLHPGDAKMNLNEIKKLVEENLVIGMGDEWENDGGQPAQFKNDVKIGDIVVIRHQSAPRYLLEVISDCYDNQNTNVWFQICRKVRILDGDGQKYKDLYAKTNRKWSDGMFPLKTFQTANNWDFAKFWYKQIIEQINLEKNIKLLDNNHNIILTGAPGTGKTYLAKQIAQQMILGKVKEKMTDDEEKQFNEQCGFVQFHPSYDYTDFVEGLRPKNENGNVGFELRDGVFKEFCKKASLYDYNRIFDKIWNLLIEDIRTELSKGQRTKIGNWNYELSSTDTLKYTSFDSPSQYSTTITKENVYDAFRGYKARNSGTNQNVMLDIVGYLKEKYKLPEYKKYVFVIDEINRGEISKIFGELFFSIDPGYRGKKGKVQTQYANLQKQKKEPNDFDKALEITNEKDFGHFFVPENVYIIGTMNDIDRSVESMDFAFRRRFAFKEVTADETQTMLDSEDAWKDENGISQKPSEDIIEKIKARMNNLNDAIWYKSEDGKIIKGIEGLSSAYHIGASYFLKLANYKISKGEYNFEDLWEYHLKGLLFEYLRGMQDVEGKLDMLHKAYQDDNPRVESKSAESDEKSSTSDNGQPTGE